MKLRVNGLEMETKANNILELLQELDINPQRVVVEVNMEIVKKDRFAEFKLKDGDSVEIVNFVGGG